jgi:hypothetical protein
VEKVATAVPAFDRAAGVGRWVGCDLAQRAFDVPLRWYGLAEAVVARGRAPGFHELGAMTRSARPRAFSEAADLDHRRGLVM